MKDLKVSAVLLGAIGGAGSKLILAWPLFLAIGPLSILGNWGGLYAWHALREAIGGFCGGYLAAVLAPGRESLHAVLAAAVNAVGGFLLLIVPSVISEPQNLDRIFRQSSLPAWGMYGTCLAAAVLFGLVAAAVRGWLVKRSLKKNAA